MVEVNKNPAPDGSKNRTIPAPRAPAHLLVGFEILRGEGDVHSAKILLIKVMHGLVPCILSREGSAS
jgi:hypothetical protein